MTDSLSPWDEIRYWNNPVSSQVSIVPGTSPQLVQYDATRTLLVITNTLPAGNLYVSPQAMSGTGQGIILNQTIPVLVIDIIRWGFLCQVAWYGVSQSSAGSVNVLTQSLKGWPQNAPNDSQAPPPEAAPFAVLDPGRRYGHPLSTEQFPASGLDY